MSVKKPWETLGSCFHVDFKKPYFVDVGLQIFDLAEEDVDIMRKGFGRRIAETVSSDHNSSESFSTNVGLSAGFGAFSATASFGIDKSSSMKYHTMRTDVTNTYVKWAVRGDIKFTTSPASHLKADLREIIEKGDLDLEKLENVIGSFYCR